MVDIKMMEFKDEKYEDKQSEKKYTEDEDTHAKVKDGGSCESADRSEFQIIQLEIANNPDEDSKIMSQRFDHYKISISCMCFGLGTWLPVNTLYSQMPLLVQYAPERLALPSYLIIIVQIANLAPALYSYFRKKLEGVKNHLITVFLVIGTISLLASAFSYNITFEIFELEHSICFFVISLMCSSVGCISSVLFLPFLNELPERYMPPYFAGVSSSGLIPSGLALIQGVKRFRCTNSTQLNVKIRSLEGEPLFGSRTFFLISSILMLLSTIAFLRLKTYSEKYCKPDNEKAIVVRDSSQDIIISKRLYMSLMLLQAAVNCFQNGILMSIQSYSCLGYGIDAYHWSVNLNQMVGPLAMYISSYFSLLSVRRLLISCILIIICIIYEIITALQSETPLFVEYSYFGPAHIVLVWVIGSGLISFVKLSIAAILRRYDKKALFYYGAVTQVGSASGAVLSFLLVNYTNVFRSKVTKVC